MAKAVFLFSLVLLLIGENLLFAKETSIKHSNRSNHNKKLLHEEKHKAVPSNKAHFPQNRNIQRCQIICPLALPPPEICNGGPNHPVASTVKPVISTTTVSTTEEPTESEESTEDTDTDSETDAPSGNSTGPSKNITSKFNHIKRGLTKTFRIVSSKELKNTLGHGDRKSTHHQLSSRQKHILLKQLNLGNRHGKKGYKFRQINPYQCQVICHVAYEEEYPSFAQPITTYDQGGDTEGNSYEEGEDTPIEITIPPVVLQDPVVAAIRPIGNNVDFIGMDDFGPSGELAGDPSTIYEEKSHKKKMEKAKPREKAATKKN